MFYKISPYDRLLLLGVKLGSKKEKQSTESSSLHNFVNEKE